ncbi:MAG TPA: GGDEF domain-containing protein [Candidatus Acidoferrum sp.]|jgi:GGDEF domain-containing protein|nr:GGDEF domain-containing protein [Candidatus Acidoferrum sp.]
MKSLITPGICLVAIAAVLHTGLVTPSPVLIAYAFYGVLTAGLLLAWRFHSSRVFFALVIVLLAQQAIGYFSSSVTSSLTSSVTSGRIAASGPGSVALAAVGLLLPLNFVLLSFQQEKGFTFSSVAPAGLLVFVESVVVAVLCRPEPSAATQHALRHAIAPLPLPFATLLAFSAAAIVLLTRFMLFHKPAESGLFWAMSACMLALRFGGTGRIPTGYFAGAAFILAGAVVETSYLLAYHDELTTLPSRRAFHDALLRLEAPYSIAMLDIDHFKRCNDTYGHDTGDQVLRMIATRLARVSGGGQAYRCGGEEFAILFPGKTTGDVLEHLEKLRADIESSTLRLRGPDRRLEARGPDRRNQRGRGRGQTGRAIRELSRVAPTASSPSSELSVTASIGVATSRRENPSAEEVVQAADKALYRAKAAGRNRVETAAGPKRRVRTKAAGIA